MTDLADRIETDPPSIADYARRSRLSEGEVADLRARIAQLEAERDTPETQNFLKGIALEAAHQRSRWGSDHDAGKAPLDWFWLIGYLAQKAATSELAGDLEKARHHTISTAAALANWHNRMGGESDAMRPGIEPPSPSGCAWCGALPIRDHLDGDDLCQGCCDKWVRGEGDFSQQQSEQGS
jgi:hypothetical protein